MESSFLPLPSEFIIPPAAHLAWSDGLNLFQFHFSGWTAETGIVIAGALGSWLGASAMYWLVRVAGRPLVLRYGKFIFFPPEKLEKAERWMSHYGSAGVFVARMLPGARQLVGIPTGIAKFSLPEILHLHAARRDDLVRGAVLRRRQIWRRFAAHRECRKNDWHLGRRRGARARRTLLFLRPPAFEEEARIIIPPRFVLVDFHFDCEERGRLRLKFLCVFAPLR